MLNCSLQILKKDTLHLNRQLCNTPRKLLLKPIQTHSFIFHASKPTSNQAMGHNLELNAKKPFYLKTTTKNGQINKHNRKQTSLESQISLLFYFG
jgi:hypothetical protein